MLDPRLDNQEVERRRELRERVDERIGFHAGILEKFDAFASVVSITDRGVVERADEKLRLTPEQSDAFRLIIEYIKKNKAELNERIAVLRAEPHVLGVTSLFGAIIVSYDSSRGVPKIVEDDGPLEQGVRGYYSSKLDASLGVVVVDVNPALRSDLVSPTVSLVHELHHHVCALIDLAVGLDAKIPMASAPRNYHHQAFADVERSESFRKTVHRIANDAVIYEALLDRPIPPITDIPKLEAVMRIIGAQRSYLDELHSSFLQKKSTWFSAEAHVYSTKGKGRHESLVGGNLRDVAATKSLLCYIQGMWCANEMHKTFGRLPEGRRAEIFVKHPQAAQWFADFDLLFIRVGAIIGASRVVMQAERLVAKEWNKLVNMPFFRENIGRFLVKFNEVPSLTANAGTGQKMMDFLLRSS